MPERTIKIPGPDHPISVTPNAKRVTVTLGGKIIADTTAALTLQEASYPAVQYIPRADVAMDLMERSATQSYCPYKGEASYFSIKTGDTQSADAIWTYEAPYDSVAPIKDHLAFYPNRVEAITEQAD